MKDSPRPYAVVDLFAGPGGLGEGFAAFRGREGGARFQTVLSVENDHHAHQTLLLRAFLRKFENDYPDEYYQFINGELAEPNWEELAPDEWREAVDETSGRSGSSTAWKPRSQSSKLARTSGRTPYNGATVVAFCHRKSGPFFRSPPESPNRCLATSNHSWYWRLCAA